MEFKYNTEVLTLDEVVPTVQNAKTEGKWVESIYNIGDSYIVTFGMEA